MKLTKEQQGIILAKIESRNLTCPVCRGEHFSFESVSYEQLSIDTSKPNPFRDNLEIMSTVVSICKNCGYIMSFSAVFLLND